MTEARQEADWNHTAALLAMLANIHRDPRRSRAFKPAEFHPIQAAKTARRRPEKGNISLLKKVFIDRRR